MSHPDITSAIRLILLRHGNTFEANQTPTQVGARTDLPLTAVGRDQAARMAAYFRDHNLTPTAIYTGTLKRQVETATLIEQTLPTRMALLNTPALMEIDYGLWEGKTTEQIQAQWPEAYAHWTQDSRWADGIFGGTLHAHMENIQVWLHQLRATYAPGDTVLGVTSNGVMRFFYSFEKEWAHLLASHQMEQLKVRTGAFCELLLLPDALTVVRWNVKV